MSPYEMNDVSGLRYYSEAVVVSVGWNGNITASPLEALNAQDSGHIVNNNTTYVGNHPSDKAETFSQSVTSKSTVDAEWVPMNAGNRVTAPNVQPNERVMLLKYANVDKFYWIDKGYNSLRRLERAEYRFSGLKDWSKMGKEEPDHANSSDNCYVMTVDTGAGLVSLTTSRANNEMSGYGIEINGKKGTLSITDSQRNKILLKSDNGKLEITTEIEVSVVAKKRIYLEAPAVVVKGDLYVSGDVNAKGDLKYSGALLNSAKSAPGETKVSLAKEEEAAALIASGMNMNNPFAQLMLAGSSAYGTGTTPAPAPAPVSPPTPAPSPAPSAAVTPELTQTFNDTNFA